MGSPERPAGLGGAGRSSSNIAKLRNPENESQEYVRLRGNAQSPIAKGCSDTKP